MRDPLVRTALILGLLSAVGPFAIDMYLPALPQVAEDLGTTEAGAALTLTAYFITLGIAQMFYGPLADAVGRKPPLVLGLAVFLAATVGAALAPDISWLVAARALQGLGAATLMAVPRAVIRDMASGPEAARMMAAIMVVISVSPMLAPFTGSMVMLWGGWREIFSVLAVAGVVSLAVVLFLLPETLGAQERRPMRFAALLSGLRRLLTDRHFMGLTMIGGFGMASFFVFLAMASFVYTRHYGLGPTGFSIAFAFNAVGFVAASQLAAPLAMRLGLERLIALAITGFLAVTAALAALVWLGADALPVVAGGLLLANACLGLVLPGAMVLSLDPHPDIAGLAASLGGTLQMVTGGLMIVITGGLFDSSVLAMVASIAFCAALACGSAMLSLPRPRLRF